MTPPFIEPAAAPEPRGRRLRSVFQPQDFAWALFVAILLLTAPETNNDALILVPLIGAFQILEPRFRPFHSPRGQVASIVLKLLLGYALIGFSDAVSSYYYPIFLIPVVSAATVLNLAGVITVILVACACYFSFLLPIFGNWEHLPPGYVQVMSLRAAFYAIVGFLVYQQARAKRMEMVRTREALDRLLDSNQNLRRAEASLRRTERLAALGQLTAGLAHELRNPLGTIKASAEMLTRQIAQNRPEILTEMASYIVSEVDRINGLIASFLDFARPLRMKATRTQLAPTLEAIVREQNDLADRSQVRIAVHNDTPDLELEFDPDMLRVALSNVLQNAIQASPPGQTVELRVAPIPDLVRIFISDHGSGISAENLENIFNPFFTTKPGGVGLGLALVSKIVDEHQGKIKVFSQSGQGTTMEITLPFNQPS